MNSFTFRKTFELKHILIACLSLACLSISGSSQVIAQGMPAPGPEIDILKKDVGEWTCEIKAWSAADADPMVTKGKESTRMFGDYFTITNFEGNMMGMDFKGHGTYGYDTRKKKYVGTWIDSLGPFMMLMEGNYDAETETLTMTGDSPGPDGISVFTYTMDTLYADGKRIMTMHMQPKDSEADQKLKLFQMTYSKQKAAVTEAK